MPSHRAPRIYARSIAQALAGALCVLAQACSSSHPSNGAPAVRAAALTPSDRALHLESFDQIWTTIRDSHWDSAAVGPAWDAARAELRPRVESAASAADARAPMRELIARLHQSHFALLPSDAVERLDPVTAPSDPAPHGVIGIAVRIVDGAPLVTAVEPGSPALAAGIRPGFVVLAIDGRPTAELVSAAGLENVPATLRPALFARAIGARLDGPVGTSVRLDLLADDDQRTTRSVTRAQPRGNPSRFGNLPTFHVTYDQRRVGPAADIGLIAFSAFLDMPRVMERFNAAVPEFSDTRALILDLRGNPGGIGYMAMAIGNWFVTKPNQRLGAMRGRDLNIDFVLNPRLEPYTRPLAILVDECSLSTSEILAGGLQDLGRARIFGVTTGGAALPSVIERLPNGDGFQYAIADYVTTSGHQLEGRGVTPDSLVPYDRAALLAGRDPPLEAAIEWILSLADR